MELFEIETSGDAEYDRVFDTLSKQYTYPALLPVDLGLCKDPYAKWEKVIFLLL